MLVARTIAEIRQAVREARTRGSGPVGLVPTMGALHEGHMSLVDAARRTCGFVVVSIFVNPAQFGPGEDYQRYPRPVERDLSACRARGVDAVFLPTVSEMYPGGFATTVRVAGLTERLCGASRPGHFEGVCTVVAKLLSIAAPDVACFGAKDYQQAIVIRRMVGDLNLPVRIEVCPTVREPDGLAMSSRNAYLTPAERAEAAALSESLRLAEDLIRRGTARADEIVRAVCEHLSRKAPSGRVDYVEVVGAEDLSPVEIINHPVVVALAVRFPSARLIDSARVDAPPPGR